ncbi:pirin family protein [Alteromonas halophila]|uniref:Pirin family protein n=1 Tax=Alteromonas halophila TaxID=516698 RepID=A0A918JLI7_9ALTE|nr:pirin family protein [Alteromonas halophila]GGW87942.1 hypothetical protein GCM10007391_22110 [Alteromonas halophila]
MRREITRKVRGVDTQDGAGVSLSRILGQQALPRLDPFLMLDYFGSDSPSEYLAGFPSHPHRGFQTVTYMLAGKMRHRDSVGNDGVIEPGGIQWMNAGRGIIHEELPQQTDGLLKGFQLWVNVPASHKMSEPDYQDIASQDVPEVVVRNSLVRVLAGRFSNTEGPVKNIPVKPLLLDVTVNGSVSLPIATDHTAFIYCFEGAISVQNTALSSGELGVLSKGDTIDVEGAGRALLVAGKAIGEPIAQYGPFVMNTTDEIQQAISDYTRGELTG